MNEPSPSGPEYLLRARDVAPTFEGANGDIERSRQLTPEVTKALIDGGFYRMLQPNFLGGGELSLAAFAEVIEEFAKFDASAAWCLSQCATCAMAAAYLDRETALEVFGPPEGIAAWGPPAPSEARMVESGYQVTGAWKFASGGHQASWIGGQSHVIGPDGAPKRQPNGAPVIRVMLFPRKDVQLMDSWNVMGLKGTGSDDYSVKDVFVPERFSFGRDEAADKRENSLLFNFSTSNVYSFGFAAVALGIARRMLDDAANIVGEKIPYGTKRAMRDNNVIQGQIGRSEAALRAARNYLYTTAQNIWRDVAENPILSMDQKIEIRLSSANAIHQSAAVADTVYHMIGSTAVFAENPFEQRFRDIHTVTQQLQGRQSHYESVGQVLLGFEPDAALFST
ncbi:MAG: acyl-CoA dehydrogenase [Rhodospirillaceae bacterium]|nr:acyl-CoA dehydrogenase [Rhodospirillaceae bacterium]